MRMLIIHLGVSTVLAISGLACAKPRDGRVDSSPTHIASDTVRGTVAVLGTDREKSIVVRQDSPPGARPVRLSGPEAEIIGRADGADVWVSGNRLPDGRLEVARFIVRSVDGQRAVDGTIVKEGDQVAVITVDGRRHPISNPPRALRDAPGARVWITGRLETGAIIFGFIDKPAR